LSRHLTAAMLTVAAMLAAAPLTAGTRTEIAARDKGCDAALGQIYIETGRYDRAIREFTCLVQAAPAEAEGYRGRIEALLLLGRFADAFRDATRVTAFVEPVHPDAIATILAGYDARLRDNPDDVPALTGASFVRWYDFDYAGAIHGLRHLVDLRPDDVYGNLFRGSSRLLRGQDRVDGIADLERAIVLGPSSPDVRWIVADAYTYGKAPDRQRAFDEASLALSWGLDTPRVHAILGAAYTAFGDVLAAAGHIQRHIDLVTTSLLQAPALPAGWSHNLPLVPGRTWEIPIVVSAGEAVSIATSSHDYWDTILVLLGPDGSPVLGSDDTNAYFAAFDWVAPQAGTYRLQVTFFESVNTGVVTVTWK
jgi:tetratricopeptide (TPR) repeat protein